MMIVECGFDSTFALHVQLVIRNLSFLLAIIEMRGKDRKAEVIVRTLPTVSIMSFLVGSLAGAVATGGVSHRLLERARPPNWYP